MKFTDFPEDFQKYWSKLGRPEQRAVIACLHNNTKKQIFRLKVKAEIDKVAPYLQYINKHHIKHTAQRVEDNIIFSFEGQEDRNAVLLGRYTL